MTMKHLVAICGAALVALWAMPAVAGDYHKGTSLVCSDCHVMHYSQSHGYNEDGTGLFTPLGPGGPYHMLLRNEINELCLTCHDNQAFAPDVFEANSNGYVREAGGLNELGGNAIYHEADGHTLDSPDAAPGGTYANADGLNCVDCHQPHGYGGPTSNPYRNLSPMSGGGFHASVTYAVATNDLTKDVYEVATSPLATHYGVGNLWFNEPDPTNSGMATWCKTCHTDFHGAKGGPEVGGADGTEWLRHPNADANIGAIGGGHSSLTQYNSHTNKAKVMSPTGVWDPAPTGVTPFCMSCHKGHGNQNAFGLILLAGTGTVTEQGDDGVAVRDLCRQCHVQGS